MNDRSMTNEQQDALEALVDACGLDLVLVGLANICTEKSDHVHVQWQDRPLSRAWLAAGTVCDRASYNARVKAVSE